MTELKAIRFHNGRPDPLPDRYVELTVRPPEQSGGLPIITLALHETDTVVDYDGIEIEINAEPMSLDFARGKALDLARRKDVRDILVVEAPALEG